MARSRLEPQDTVLPEPVAQPVKEAFEIVKTRFVSVEAFLHRRHGFHGKTSKRDRFNAETRIEIVAGARKLLAENPRKMSGLMRRPAGTCTKLRHFPIDAEKL
jgi:hypothetical protein